MCLPSSRFCQTPYYFFYYKVRQVLLHGATILLQSAIGSTKYNRTVRVTEGKLTENV